MSTQLLLALLRFANGEAAKRLKKSCGGIQNVSAFFQLPLCWAGAAKFLN